MAGSTGRLGCRRRMSDKIVFMSCRRDDVGGGEGVLLLVAIVD